MRGYYVVLDVGQMGEKTKALQALKNEASGRQDLTSPIILIDGRRKMSASKL
jgi:hypothetical protein